MNGTINKNYDEEISQINSNIADITSNVSYTAPTSISNGTVNGGGYAVICRNVVLVNIRFTASANGAVSISGLPKYNNVINANIVPTTIMRMDNNTNPAIFGYLNTSGVINIENCVANGQYIVSCVYLAN